MRNSSPIRKAIRSALLFLGAAATCGICLALLDLLVHRGYSSHLSYYDAVRPIFRKSARRLLPQLCHPLELVARTAGGFIPFTSTFTLKELPPNDAIRPNLGLFHSCSSVIFE
jgi:hypothetical protein